MRFSILLTLLSLSFLPSALADDGKVSFGNEMDSIVEAVFCVDQRGRTKEIAGPVGMKSSVFIVAELLEADCERLALRMDDGRGWQFYFEPATNTAKEIALSWESVVPVSNAEYPSLFLNFGKDVFTAPAGVPLVNAIHLLRCGTDKDTWRDRHMPQPLNTGDL